MLPGQDQKKMAQVREVSSRIKGQIRIDHKENTITLSFSTDDEQARTFLKGLLTQFSDALATQLTAFFGIQGEIVNVGKER